jgi:hypothetical protein
VIQLQGGLSQSVGFSILIPEETHRFMPKKTKIDGAAELQKKTEEMEKFRICSRGGKEKEERNAQAV